MKPREDWIEWRGGECPELREVDYVMRIGSYICTGVGKSLKWNHQKAADTPGSGDIVKYRLHLLEVAPSNAGHVETAGGIVIPPNGPDGMASTIRPAPVREHEWLERAFRCQKCDELDLRESVGDSRPEVERSTPDQIRRQTLRKPSDSHPYKRDRHGLKTYPWESPPTARLIAGFPARALWRAK